MRLRDVARYFDRMTCKDAFGTATFKGQLDLFQDSVKDTEGTTRRILSVAPDTVIPARRVIEANGTFYLVGDHYDDNFNDSIIRSKYIIVEAHEVAEYQSLNGICTSETPTSTYAAKTWVKDSKDVAQISDLTGVFRISLADTENVQVNHVIRIQGKYYLVRQVDTGPSGIKDATCDEITNPAVEDAELTQSTFDPVTETKTQTTQTIRVVRLRWQSLFEYRNIFAPKFTYDDQQVVISKSVLNVSSGNTVTLSDGKWFINTLLDRGDVWVCHVSRHA